MNTKLKGDIAEAKILSKLTERGYTVLIPWGDRDRYDLVFELDGEFHRVQCKKARYVNGSAKFPVCSSSVHRNGQRHTYHGDIDYFAVWCEEVDEVYLIPFEDVSNINRAVSIRIEQPQNNQRSGIRWAEDYAL